MSITLFVPQLEGSKARAKDYVVSILGKSWPHSTKELYGLIKKQFSFSATYQAVYKAIKELEAAGVVKSGKDGYSININWIEQLHSYTEIVQSNYFTKNRLRIIEGVKEARTEGNINILTFETLFDVEKYLYFLQKNWLSNTKGKGLICLHHNSEWRPLFYLRAEFNWVRKIRDAGLATYVLCANDSPLDRWCAKFYRAIGCNIKLGVNCANMCELLVFGDYVIQVYVPMQLKDTLKNRTAKYQSFEDMDIPTLFNEIMEKRMDIQVVVNLDPKLAGQLKEETLAHFPSQRERRHKASR